MQNFDCGSKKFWTEFDLQTGGGDGWINTSEILNTLKDAKMLVVEGTIYPLLTRLKNTGLLNYRWEESTSGPPRKYYQLTETGKIFLTELTKTWDELKNAVNLVTRQKQKK